MSETPEQARSILTELVSKPAPDPKVVDIVARTIYGEARGEGNAGMVAVANVIMNRANNPRWWGLDPAGVCTKPYQFSCWLPGPDRDALTAVTKADPIFCRCIDIATQALEYDLPDTTFGADSYFVEGSPVPAWEAKAVFTVKIMHQRFYRAELPPPL